MKKIIPFLVVFATMIGCSTANLPSAHDNVTVPSLIVDTAKALGVRVEDIGTVLIIANARSIGVGTYTKQQALDAFKEARALFDGPLTNAAFRAGVAGLDAKYPGLLDIADIYLEAFTNDELMHYYDRKLLKEFLDKRITSMERAIGN